jgi:hypothetical protein
MRETEVILTDADRHSYESDHFAPAVRHHGMLLLSGQAGSHGQSRSVSAPRSRP